MGFKKYISTTNFDDDFHALMSQPCRIYTIKLVFVKKPHFIADILMFAFTEPPFRGREKRHAMALMGRKCVL